MLRHAVPSTQAVRDREASSNTRPTTTIWRCAVITDLM